MISPLSVNENMREETKESSLSSSMIKNVHNQQKQNYTCKIRNSSVSIGVFSSDSYIKQIIDL